METLESTLVPELEKNGVASVRSAVASAVAAECWLVLRQQAPLVVAVLKSLDE